MTHEEFLFNKQLLGEVLDYEIKDEVLYIKDHYDCYDEVLPDNIVFEKDLLIFKNLKSFPNGLKIYGQLISGESHIGENNYNIKETPTDMIVLREQMYSGFPYLKYLNHIKNGDTLNYALDISFTNIEVLPDNLTINGTLDVCHSKLKQLPNNLTVVGGIEFSKTSASTVEFINSATIGGDIWYYYGKGVMNLKGNL